MASDSLPSPAGPDSGPPVAWLGQERGPGGIGAMTVVMLLKNTLQAFERFLAGALKNR